MNRIRRLGLWMCLAANLCAAAELPDTEQTVLDDGAVSDGINESNRGSPPWNPALMQQAEMAYRDGRYEAAMDQFGVIAALYRHPFAWLRIGNVWHRRGRVSQAIHAYRQARDAADVSPGWLAIAKRAEMNLALVGLHQASSALTGLVRDGNERVTLQWRQEMHRRLVELQRALPSPENLSRPLSQSHGLSMSTGRFAPE